MAKTRIASAGRTPKSNVEIIRDIAIKKHANNPEIIEEIERRTWEFQKRELSGEVLDRSAALQQFGREIEGIGVPIPRPPKEPGPKTDPIVKTCAPHRVASPPKPRSVAKRGKKSDPKKRRPSKGLIKN
jgi:hypothetical protein